MCLLDARSALVRWLDIALGYGGLTPGENSVQRMPTMLTRDTLCMQNRRREWPLPRRQAAIAESDVKPSHSKALRAYIYPARARLLWHTSKKAPLQLTLRSLSRIFLAEPVKQAQK